MRGRLVYFGRLADDPQGQLALQKWLDQKDDLLAGRTPQGKTIGLTIKDLLNQFRARKKSEADSGKITPRVFLEYQKTWDRIRDTLGLTRLVVDLTAQDFEQLRTAMAKTLGLATVKLEIAKTKATFNYAYQAGLIDRPVRFGPAFKTPSDAVIRRARSSDGPKMFEAAEIRQLLAATDQTMRAMILLAVNCGYGNNDLATLPRSAVDLDTGWVNHPRPKTGAPRRCRLWPETVAALREVCATRPEPKDTAHANLVFLRRDGTPVVGLRGKTWKDSVGANFWYLAKTAGLRRRGHSFYALRHTFETIGGGSKDQVAVNYIMGHVDGTMAATYRERIDDSRLVAVADHVRAWLFGAEAADQGGEAAGRRGLKIVG